VSLEPWYSSWRAGDARNGEKLGGCVLPAGAPAGSSLAGFMLPLAVADTALDTAFDTAFDTALDNRLLSTAHWVKYGNCRKAMRLLYMRFVTLYFTSLDLADEILVYLSSYLTWAVYRRSCVPPLWMLIHSSRPPWPPGSPGTVSLHPPASSCGSPSLARGSFRRPLGQS
jgi:hypothetical protein